MPFPPLASFSKEEYVALRSDLEQIGCLKKIEKGGVMSCPTVNPFLEII